MPRARATTDETPFVRGQQQDFFSRLDRIGRLVDNFKYLVGRTDFLRNIVEILQNFQRLRHVFDGRINIDAPNWIQIRKRLGLHIAGMALLGWVMDSELV